jgi:hypothetical protein
MPNVCVGNTCRWQSGTPSTAVLCHLLSKRSVSLRAKKGGRPPLSDGAGVQRRQGEGWHHTPIPVTSASQQQCPQQGIARSSTLCAVPANCPTGQSDKVCGFGERQLCPATRCRRLQWPQHNMAHSACVYVLHGNEYNMLSQVKRPCLPSCQSKSPPLSGNLLLSSPHCPLPQKIIV